MQIVHACTTDLSKNWTKYDEKEWKQINGNFFSTNNKNFYGAIKHHVTVPILQKKIVTSCIILVFCL